MKSKLMNLALEFESLVSRRAGNELNEAEFLEQEKRLNKKLRWVPKFRLLGALKHESPSVRRLAATALGARVRCWDRYPRLVFHKSPLAVLSRLLEVDTEKTLKNHETTCREQSFEVRLAAVQTLGRFMPWPMAVRGLVTALQDPNERVMRVAFMKLKSFTSPEVISEVILRQHQADPILKKAIGQYFEGIDRETLFKGFQRALDKNRDPEVKREIFAGKAFQAIHNQVPKE